MIRAMRKQTNRPLASTIVVTKGALTTAGSIPMRLARIGISDPTKAASVQIAPQRDRDDDSQWLAEYEPDR